MSGRHKRGVAFLPALLLGLGLGGCAGDLDPAYWFPDGKKKLPGERRELFPGGVPGVTQGVPPELIRGSPENQALHAVEAAPGIAAAPPQQPQVEPQAQEKPKPPARPKVARKPTALPRPEPAAEQPAQKPAPSQPGAWPSPQAQQQSQQPSASGWPAPVPAGTFTR